MEVYLARIAEYVLDPLIRLMFFAAVIYFCWGLFVMIAGAEEESKRTEGKRHMLWASIGMTVMVLAIAIIQFVEGLVGSVVR